MVLHAWPPLPGFVWVAQPCQFHIPGKTRSYGIAGSEPASHPDFLRGSSCVPASQTSAASSGKKRRPITADFQIRHGKCTLHLDEKFLERLSSKKDQKALARWRPYSLNYSVNSHAFVVETALTISLKKLLRRFNLLNGSRPLQSNKVRKKILPFVQLQRTTPPLLHPQNNLMSKWHLIHPLQKEIYKTPTLIS